MSFSQLMVSEPILRALTDAGYSRPTPIQEQSIPLVLSRKDLLACAQTGTGKTAGFAIPVLQLLQEDKLSGKGQAGIKVLVLTPTRELAIQVEESFRSYGNYLGFRSITIFGGVSQVPQVQALQKGVDILIATPGRLLDLASQNLISFSDLRYFVLDEADRMLDMGFIHDVKKVLKLIPAKRQSLFFSATMPPEIRKLADQILHAPESIAVNPVSSTAELISQELYFASKEEKRFLLLEILQQRKIRTALVFTRTKYGADKIAKFLVKSGVPAAAIHGDKSQGARQQALGNFKEGKIRVLVATDIAARGIDIDALAFVINYEIPNVPETYVHRIGRTGRAGAEGTAISFCDSEEKAYVRDIEKLIKKRIPVMTVSTGNVSAS
ncbi:DEAD/DEAH box helicase [Flavihumibacter solisilvae]|uniref:DEAD-box ATP-dependent RNA helicase RhpA n=1 Tax=Flavihumibacter solisilvae TaxID=1349421 RepID=A0A0C1J0T9_9BACT|nr:DEAD/DEAH box helicase [Flavihumibacter solisilvae]KIC96394.1 DEAD/DEAH box helicase [Flavihumibacter solisilvae]